MGKNGRDKFVVVVKYCILLNCDAKINLTSVLVSAPQALGFSKILIKWIDTFRDKKVDTPGIEPGTARISLIPC